MEMFYAQIVEPALEVEPGHGVKEAYLNKLINYLACEEGTSSRDLDLVRQICTGRLQRHPALHGVPWMETHVGSCGGLMEAPWRSLGGYMPAIQLAPAQVMTACAIRINNLEEGKTTFRNPKRAWEG